MLAGAEGVEQADIEDEDSFAISQSGVLTFMASPSYEPPGDEDDDNVYRVTVQASDGIQIGYSKVTVHVTDIEETGTVTVSVNPEGPGNAIAGLQQFMPNAVLTASVTDPDAATSQRSQRSYCLCKCHVEMVPVRHGYILAQTACQLHRSGRRRWQRAFV